MVTAYQDKLNSIATKIVEKEDKLEKNKQKLPELEKNSNKVVKVGKARVSTAKKLDNGVESTKQENKKLEKEIEDLKKESKSIVKKMLGLQTEIDDSNNETGNGDGGDKNPPPSYTPSGGSASTSGSGSVSNQKTQAELDLEEFKKKYEESLEYIELHNMLDDWHLVVDENGKADSEAEAYKRIAAYTAQAYSDGKLDDDYYEQTIKSLAKSLHTAQRDEYSARFQDSLDYIEKNNKYGTWGDDNIFKAIERIQKYTDEARQNLIIDNDTYINNIGKIEELLETQISSIIEGESEKRKKAYQNEFDIEKQLIEERLELRREEYKKQSAYLDELVKKREQAKEDEDYAVQMERLKLKLEYETDETNKNALNKEIDKLQEQIDDTEFERDIERRRENIEAMQEKAEESAQKGIDLITDYYTAKMADVNIAKEITDSVDMGEFQQIGSTIGEWVATGFKLKIDSMVDSIVSSLENLPSPQTFVTNDNSKTLNISPNYQLPENATATDYLKATRRAFDEITFFEGY